VVGGAATDNDCKVCHYEAVDTQNYHQNNQVDLRDPDTGNPITAFTKFTRDRTSDVLESWITNVQNNLCLKCHDIDGATVTRNVDDGGTAMRPFSATSRDVPNVFDRFDSANSFHHAVRDAGDNAYCIPRADSTPAFNPTMAPPWNQDVTGGPYNDGHDMITCFDCHGDVVSDPDLTTNLISIHGGANQRMLRTSIDFDGVEAAGVAQDVGLIPTSVRTNTETFCLLCHKSAVYVETSDPGSVGSIFEHHGASQNQHRASGGNELACMGCHAGIVDFGPPADDNGALRGNLHGDSFTWGTGSFTTGLATEHFVLGGWISGWKTEAGQGYCRGGDCAHTNSSKSYTLDTNP
jgi:nitrate/TMAO reductase-like tetraheme cytochrome c subunit